MEQYGYIIFCVLFEYACMQYDTLLTNRSPICFVAYVFVCVCAFVCARVCMRVCFLLLHYRTVFDARLQFLQSTMHELVSSAGEIKLTPELQYMPGQENVRRTFQINFGQVYLAKPTAREKDG